MSLLRSNERMYYRSLLGKRLKLCKMRAYGNDALRGAFGVSHVATLSLVQAARQSRKPLKTKGLRLTFAPRSVIFTR